jgi:5'-nucleotidase
MNSTDWNADTPVILVTNDDGIRSPGLAAAVEAVRDLGYVVVAAPTEQQTARGRSIVGDRDDHFHRVDVADRPAWHINASPALVVRHAIAVFFDTRYPDLVVSGINYGENLGTNITISGTLGAAFQAASQGVPALAMSRQTEIIHHFEHGELDWSDAARVTRRWAEKLIAKTFRGPYRPPDGHTPATRLPFDLLKIDVPDQCPPGTEERYTRLSRRHYFFSEIDGAEHTTPLGASQTRIDTKADSLEPDDDIYAIVVDRVVSVTPLQLDNTAPLDESSRALS